MARVPRPTLSIRPDEREAHRLVRWAFYLFVFSIPLEYPDRSIPLEVHTITGSLFLIVALLQPRLCFRRPPAAFWWLAVYVWVQLLLGLVAAHSGEAFKWFANYLLVTCLFWVGYNLMRRESVARASLLSFVLACGLLALLHALDIGTRTAGLTDRRTVFGQDANLLGGNMAIGLIALIALASGARRSAALLWIAAAGLGLLLGNSIMLSGSRGAMLACGVGLVGLTLQIRNIRALARNVAIAVLAGAALTAAAYRSEGMMKRFEQTLVAGKLSGREQIFPTGWQMFLEKPLTGWGPADNRYELGWRTVGFQIGSRWAAGLAPKPDKDFHNLLLEALTATGLVGTIPLLTCIGLCARAAWKARRGARGTTPVAFVAVVLFVSMTINWSAAKQFWLILAYAAASPRRGIQ